MADLLSFQILGNPGIDWLVALAIAVGTHVVLRLTVSIVLSRLKAFASRTQTDVDDLIAELLEKTKFIFIALIALWAGSLYLTLPPAWDRGLENILVIGVLLQAAYWANGLVSYALNRYKKKQIEEDPGIVTALGTIGFLVRVAVFSIFLLMALANLGIEVGPLIASLGIGGIAIALALQNVLGDLFASISIVFDKPFEVGDFIQVGTYSGTVEHVGLKTSRVRSLTGEQLVFNNSDLLGARIQNYKRLTERRIAFKIGVTYDTPREKLERIPEIIREVIEGTENTRFDRCHFMSFGDSALIFDTVYYVLLPDYIVYADVNHKINLGVFSRFEAEGIDFAFPTQTVHLAREVSPAN